MIDNDDFCGMCNAGDCEMCINIQPKFKEYLAKMGYKDKGPCDCKH